MRKIDLSGHVYGNLTVVKEAPRRGRAHRHWIVLCVCGGSAEVSGMDLRRKDGKNRVSCGCMNHPRGKSSPLWKSHNDIPLSYFNHVRDSARSRGIPFEVTLDTLQSQWDVQGGECYLTGRTLVLSATASLDRVDNARGYSPDNVAWCHKDLNRMKNSHSLQEFLSICREVVRHNERS